MNFLFSKQLAANAQLFLNSSNLVVLETNRLSPETRGWLAILQGLLERIGLSHILFDSIYSVRNHFLKPSSEAL